MILNLIASGYIIFISYRGGGAALGLLAFNFALPKIQQEQNAIAAWRERNEYLCSMFNIECILCAMR